jgi:hypothetical protein
MRNSFGFTEHSRMHSKLALKTKREAIAGPSFRSLPWECALRQGCSQKPQRNYSTGVNSK